MNFCQGTANGLLLSAILSAEGSVIALEVAGLPLRSNWFAIDWDPIDFLQSGGYGMLLIASGVALALVTIYNAKGMVLHLAWLWGLGSFVGLMLFAGTQMIRDSTHPWTLFVMQTALFMFLLVHYLWCVMWDDAARP